MQFRVLIASDDQAVAQRMRGVMVEHGVECPAGHLVPLDSAADRSGLLRPELVTLVMPPDWKAGWAVLRETRSVVPHARVLVLGPANDPKRILETLKQGADEFLDREAAEAEMAGALGRFQAASQRTDSGPSGGRIIAVLAASGGSGASTLAAGISTVLAQEHGQAGLIDLRLGVGDQTAMFDLRPSRTLTDVCDHLARLDQSLFEQFLTRHPSGVHLLAAPIVSAEADRVTAKGVRRALALARVRFPCVVVDMSNILTAEQVEVLWQADQILLVARLDYTSVRNTRRAIDAMAELGISRDRMRLVLNACGQRRQLEVEQAEVAIGLKAAQCIPYNAAVVHSAVNHGEPVVMRRSFSRISVFNLSGFRQIFELLACPFPFRY
jgi:pilus assembly protein CpaE